MKTSHPKTALGHLPDVVDTAGRSHVEERLVQSAAASFLPRQIGFVRPRDPRNGRPPSVSDGSGTSSALEYAAQQTTTSANGTTVTTYRPGSQTDAAKAKNAKDDFKEPARSLYPAEKVEQLLVWQHVQKMGKGLHNLGNTCFLVRVVLC
jgi:hypothetical protein